jgi:hypothetical protein
LFPNWNSYRIELASMADADFSLGLPKIDDHLDRCDRLGVVGQARGRLAQSALAGGQSENGE